MACAPAVLLFEHIGWEDAPLHFTQFLACLLCAASAWAYLKTRPRPRALSWLAYTALFATAGYRLLCVVAGLVFAIGMRDF